MSVLVTSLRWGIMGSGGIAAAMAGALRGAGSPIAAVGSGHLERSTEFARQWGISLALGSHRAVAECDDVDIVYVATTNDRHYRNVLDCVEFGKPALCEKPMALNSDQTAEMLEAAVGAKVFVMEALWMRFQPFLSKVDELIADGVIGEVRHVTAGLSFSAPVDAARRWINRDLGGGSLLDLGIYPLSLVHHLLGPPTRFEAIAQVGPTDVDLNASVISQHDGGSSAASMCSFTAEATNEAVVAGSEALIRIHSPFHHSPLLTVERRGEVVASFDTSIEGHGFEFEVTETERCVTNGLVESPLRPHSETLAVMRWMDAIRAACGISYPADLT